KIFLTEALDDRGVVQVGLGDEFRGRLDVFFFFAVDGDLRFVLVTLLLGRFLFDGVLDGMLFVADFRHVAYSLKRGLYTAFRPAVESPAERRAADKRPHGRRVVTPCSGSRP